jgi:serine/threonine protein kinase
LLLASDGHILKITDFGVSTVFKQPFGNVREKRRGVAGSGPYIAPEEYGNQEYDSELVDIWSVGVIAYVMNTNTIPWQAAGMSN